MAREAETEAEVEVARTALPPEAAEEAEGPVGVATAIEFVSSSPARQDDVAPADGHVEHRRSPSDRTWTSRKSTA